MNWWDDFFTDDYAAYGLASTKPEDIARMCDVIIQRLNVRPGDTIFDQCCGIGRLSIPLAERGFSIIGVDQSKSYIDACTREASQRSLPCEFHHGDALKFTASRPCDGGINWFTSFGYFEDDRKNVEMLHRASESLKSGARFLLEYFGLPRMFAEYRPSVVNRSEHPKLREVIVLNENSVDFGRGMVESDWTMIYPDGRRTQHRLSTRMFVPRDLQRLFIEAGFEDLQLWAGLEDKPFDRTSARLVVDGRKPRA